MPTGQQYATNVPQTTLTGLINATATIMSVASSSGWPATPFTAILDIGTSTQEPVDVTNITGTTWTVTRAIDGTVGFTHQVGSTVTHGDIGRDFREARTHIDASTGQHGISGGSSVVGTTDVQNLSNKTLVAPTVSGTVAMGSGGWSGTGTLSETALTFQGISGANAQFSRLAGTTLGLPPVAGTFTTGDIVYDAVGQQWYCTSGGTPGTWVPVNGSAFLAKTVLGGTQSSVSLSIPTNASLNRVKIFWRARGDQNSAVEQINLRLNSDSGTNYIWQKNESNNAGTSTSNSGGAVAQIQVGTMPSNTATANYYGAGEITIEGVADATRFANILALSGAASSTTDTWNARFSGLHLASGATTSVTLLPNSNNFVANSSFIMYGYV